jgi:hypothetical protein
VGSGSFLGLGVKVGDVIRLGATTADDDINAVVATVARTSTVASARRWANFTADTNATAQEHEEDHEQRDADSVGVHVRGSTIRARRVGAGRELPRRVDEAGSAERRRAVEFGLDRQPRSPILGTAAAPGLTSPTQYTSIGLVVQDATLYLAGTVIGTVTGGEIMFDLGGDGVRSSARAIRPMSTKA